MLRLVHPLKGYGLSALDDEFGTVKDFLFDDGHWTVRYMVADTGRWLPGRMVLISPISLEQADWNRQAFAVNMTRKQIEHAPDLASDAPVSRQYEIDWAIATGIPPYWGYAYPWGPGMAPWDLMHNAQPLMEVPPTKSPEEQERVLRSTEEVRKYRVRAADGEVGHVEDFIMDDDTWVIRYLMVDTRNWLPGRKVLLSPDWFDEIRWADNSITTPIQQETIKESPEFDPRVPVNRSFEEQLYDFYGKPVYWS